jgi:hypothetical protein
LHLLCPLVAAVWHRAAQMQASLDIATQKPNKTSQWAKHFILVGYVQQKTFDPFWQQHR